MKLYAPWILAAALAGCGGESQGTADKPAVSALKPITDTNDDPGVVEVSLVASVAQQAYLASGPAEVWAYRDGSDKTAEAVVPGPLIEAQQGDRVIVHFRNQLPDATTIHWHGVRVPNEADGTEATQEPVPPGGEFTYEFVARDAGTFWYHPHAHGDVQIERGLQGMLVVHGGTEVPVDAERMLVLDDVKLKASGALSESTTSLDIMLGRLGNYIVANGVVDGQLSVAANARERWHIVNTANGRYFNLHLPGHSLRVVGWDGGLLAEPYDADSLLIVPGERYEVLVELDEQPGSALTLQTLYYDRGHDIPDPGPETVLTLKAGPRLRRELGALPATWGDAPELGAASDAVGRLIVMNERELNGGQDVEFTFNDHTFPDVPQLDVKPGDVEVWTLDNQSEMDHPFHLHGMFFRVLDVDGAPPEHDGWKDTVNVPMKSKLRFAVRYEDAGTWMYHCHILEHADRGMMGELVIAPGGG